MTARSTTPAPPAGETVEAIGVNVAERIYASLVVDHKLNRELISYPAGPAPEDADEDSSLVELPTESLADAIADLVAQTAQGHESTIRGVGIAIPGLIRNGVVEEAPNLPQLKGARIEELVSSRLPSRGITAPVTILNDADAMAAGIAVRRGKLDHMVRVWTIGTGIGYGCYPFAEGVWEGGHTVVTLDDKENYCGCGGRGHLEGIMGHRAMRLRFLDMEPEEVFENANRRSDPRCVEFKLLWHKALAAATASVIHQAGARKFYITGYNVRFLDLNLLKDYLHQMVKMSPLQSYSVEVVDDEPTTRVLGAAVAAEQRSAR
ncbi:MAG TPA: ROK family protein [Candidatus Dormibacteraeota bacterium]|jgi:predicted NBD/HSP70 family sugar kinase|nr:ROK family protein [Candidatus Dormibacteraeota bacterium]